MTEDEKRWLEQEIKRFNSVPALLEAMARSESNDFRTLRQEVEDGLHHPSGEDLYNYVLGWLDQDHSLRVLDHVVFCGRCLEEVMKIQQIEEALTKDALERADKLSWIERVKEFVSSLSFPVSIWKKLRQRRRSTTGPEIEVSGGSSKFGTGLSYAFGGVLVVICFIGLVELSHVFRHSDRPSSPMIALSSVSWNRDLTPQVGIFPPHRETVAFLLLVKDFEPSMSQEQIDSLYRALKPDERDQLRYRFVSPSEVKQAFVGGAIIGGAPIAGGIAIALVGKKLAEAIFKSFRGKLDVQKVVLVTLVSAGHEIRVRIELVDARTEKGAGEAAEAPATLETLEPTVRRLAYNSLSQGG